DPAIAARATPPTASHSRPCPGYSHPPRERRRDDGWADSAPLAVASRSRLTASGYGCSGSPRRIRTPLQQRRPPNTIAIKQHPFVGAARARTYVGRIRKQNPRLTGCQDCALSHLHSASDFACGVTVALFAVTACASGEGGWAPA